MHRNALRQLLVSYPITFPDDKIHWEKVCRFVENQPRCFERDLARGHITGSAWIVSPDQGQALLTHHRKLNRWLQLGGHADGDPDIFAVALREAQEESGLRKIKPLSTEIFDIDVHPIPPTPTEPAHFHYDIRFIFAAHPTEPLTISRESKDLAWIELTSLQQLDIDRSLSRMVEKMHHQFKATPKK